MGNKWDCAGIDVTPKKEGFRSAVDLNDFKFPLPNSTFFELVATHSHPLKNMADTEKSTAPTTDGKKSEASTLEADLTKYKVGPPDLGTPIPPKN